MTGTLVDFFKGSLIASIAHAIMTNVYPDLSYEHSWDGINYSIQNSAGLRGTITFKADFCVGAIRYDAYDCTVDATDTSKYLKCFPERIIRTAYEETLQYLLLEKHGRIIPCVTSVFWADSTSIHYEQMHEDALKRDMVLFDKILLPEAQAVQSQKEYYCMDSKSINLLSELYQIKTESFFKTITLTEKQKKCIPGHFINNECIESLKELNIVV